MNRLEFVLMNNPLRQLVQRTLEVKRMWKLARLQPGASLVLEIGCGSGYGTKLIKKHFKPKHIEAIDLDPKMIKVAIQKNQDPSVTFSVGDAACLTYEDKTFDAIFDFGIIHHIPNWKDCLKELQRVLKPGGTLVLEDLSIETFTTRFGKILRRLLVHPYDSMYTKKEFFHYLESQGFKIIHKAEYNPLGLIKYFILIANK